MVKKIFIIIFLLSVLLHSQQIKELVFVYDEKESYPVQLGNGPEIPTNKPGVAVEAIYILEKKLGIKIILKRFPWNRCFEELKSGKADGLFLASYKPEREEFGNYPKKNGKLDEDRYFNNAAYYFYKLKNSKVEWDGKTLKNANLGVGAPMGYSIVDDLKKMGINVIEGANAKIDTINLMKGRLDVIAELESAMDAIIESNPEYKKNIEKLSPPIVSKTYYLMLSKQLCEKYPELAERIWDTIKSIREKELKKIILE